VEATTEQEIDLLIEFLNTVDEEDGSDELPDDSAAATWFAEHGLAADGLRAKEARQARDALRAAVDDQASPGGLPGVGLTVNLSPAGEPMLDSPHPLGPLLITAARLAIEDRWQRIKLCAMHSCRYAFYDESRNRSGRWCSMKVCGNRAKTRAFRSRQRS
jgi:hypothetical protein